MEETTQGTRVLNWKKIWIPSKTSLAVVAATVLASHATGSPVSAWTFTEHSDLGSRSYARACAELCKLPPPDSDARRRLELACGPCSAYSNPIQSWLYSECANLPRDTATEIGPPEPTSATGSSCDRSERPESERPKLRTEAVLFGQACALAGDHLLTPEEFGSDLSWRSAASVGRFLRQAVINRRHFVPHSHQEYRRHHDRAVILAASVSKSESAQGVEERLRAVLASEAFACHFLQDSFAAGHMGFNRGASSNTPSRLFHNHWNEAGRCVRNAALDSWAMLGDRFLCEVRNWQNLCRLAEANYHLVVDVLRAFVEGEATSDIGWEVREQLPLYFARAGSGQVRIKHVFNLAENKREAQHHHPRSSVADGQGCIEVDKAVEYLGAEELVRPALPGFWLELQHTASGVRSGTDGPVTFFAGSIALPLLKEFWGGLQGLTPRYHFAFGEGDWDGQRRRISRLALGIPIAFTHDGLMTHEILTGAISAQKAARSEVVYDLSYRLSAELGRYSLFVQAGRTWNADSDMLLVTGIGFALQTKGGGPLRDEG